MRIRLLQFGDLHIDASFTTLSDIEGKPFQRRQDLKRTLSRIIDLALSKNPDIVLVCGDLYEHGYAAKGSIHYICDQFKRIGEIPVLMIPGNHDPYVPGSFYSEHQWPSNVHILGTGDIYEHPLSARVYGGLGLGETDPSFINILMHHGTLDMPFNSGAFQPISSGDMEGMGFDYCALGHFHTRILGAGSQGIFYNAGSPEPLGFDEEGDHGVFLSTIEKDTGNGSRTTVDFVKLSSRNTINLEIAVGGCMNSEQAAGRVATELERAGTSEDLYRVFLKGRISPGIRIDPEAVVEQLEGKFFYIKIIDDTSPDFDLEQISNEQGLRGLFTRKMLERLAKADKEEAKLVMQALYYGLEAIDEGKVCV